MKKVCAIVVTYNRKMLLEECLDAILNQNYDIAKIVIIDNNSNDGTSKLIKEKYDCNDRIEYIKLNKNIGGAGGFYEGIKYARNFQCDYIWIMDDDTIPQEDCLYHLIQAANVIGDKASFFASSVVGINGEPMNTPIISNRSDNNGYKLSFTELSKCMVEIESATFVSLLINSKACMKWGDDSEYTKRLSKYYGAAYLVGNSIAVHKRQGGGILSLLSEDNVDRIKLYFYFYRNRVLYAKAFLTWYEVFLRHLEIIKSMFRVILKSKCKYKKAKIRVLLKSLYVTLLGKYDKRGFNNRMNIGL